jgi:quercetin dioxygenase-like cupin family protein
MADHEPDQRTTGSAIDPIQDEAWSTLALSLTPVAPAPEVRARLLAALSGPERFTLFAAEVARAFELSPETAREALRAIDDESAWSEGELPGSVFLSTPALLAARVFISRLPARTRIPKHPHPSREVTMVLEGLLIEDGCKQHGPGAVLDMSPGTEHEIVVGADAACTVVFFHGQA